MRRLITISLIAFTVLIRTQFIYGDSNEDMRKQVNELCNKLVRTYLSPDKNEEEIICQLIDNKGPIALSPLLEASMDELTVLTLIKIDTLLDQAISDSPEFNRWQNKLITQFITLSLRYDLSSPDRYLDVMERFFFYNEDKKSENIEQYLTLITMKLYLSLRRSMNTDLRTTRDLRIVRHYLDTIYQYKEKVYAKPIIQEAQFLEDYYTKVQGN